jgi:hypothetical protein
MSIFNIFSKRQKFLRGETPDVYVYNNIPQKLKAQIIHIVRDAIGINLDTRYSDKSDEIYQYIFNALCREYGKFSLAQGDSAVHQLFTFFETSKNVEENLDFIELTFQTIQDLIGNQFNYYANQTNATMSPDVAINELNQRFKENGIGYQFEGNEIIKVDSTYIHTEITKPVISLLWSKKFLGANEEYLKAHEHYRHNRNKECLTECLKAFESTLKIICKEKKWAFNQNDTSKKLIQICFQNELVPTFTQNQFTSLQNLLESGIPTIRNKVGGHGQGQIPQKVDDEMTRYGLNLTGTNIIFLIEMSGVK